MERLLGRFPDALRDLSLAAARQTAPDRIAVRAALHLPTRTLVAEVIEPEANAALDKLCDVLAAEIKRHRDQLRRDWDYRRKDRGAEKSRASSRSNPAQSASADSIPWTVSTTPTSAAG